MTISSWRKHEKDTKSYKSNEIYILTLRTEPPVYFLHLTQRTMKTNDEGTTGGFHHGVRGLCTNVSQFFFSFSLYFLGVTSDVFPLRKSNDIYPTLYLKTADEEKD